MGSITAHPGLLDRTVSQQVSLCLAINWIKLSRSLSALLFNVSMTGYFRMQSGIRYSGVVPNPMPAADVDVTVELVRRLLADQHQDLAGQPVEFLANGWDNAMFRLGDDLLVRLPRREPAAQILLNEQRWLPVLAPKVQLPIPSPERTGRPAHGYPFSWSVVPYLPGEPAADADSLDLADAAGSVGGFLGSLHAPAPPDAPANPFRGVPLADRAGAVAANLRLLSDRVDRDAVQRAWSAALAAPVYSGPPRWLHGDLHPANILVSHGRVSGVIDFGDITAGDPATDLAVAWMLLPLEHHAAFRAAYRSARTGPARSAQLGALDGATPDDAGLDDAGLDDAGLDGADWAALWTRARGWALNLAIVLLAHSADNPQLLNVGRRTLHRVLTP
jgi:aminoglycoside phosphotransferase (APT) family kinase protein